MSLSAHRSPVSSPIPLNAVKGVVAKAFGAVLVAGLIVAAEPWTIVSAFAHPSPAASALGGCARLSPVEGAIADFEQSWNARAGANDPVFGGQRSRYIPDIAGILASPNGGTGCPATPMSAADNSGGASGNTGTGALTGNTGSGSGSSSSSGGSGSSQPQCALFTPVEEQVLGAEKMWNSNAPSGVPQFGGDSGGAGPLPDIAGSIAGGSNCTDGVSAGGGPSGGSGSGGSSSPGPQCALFSPLEGVIDQIEDTWNSSVPSGVPQFGNPLPDVADAYLAANTQCPDTADPASAGSTTTTTVAVANTTTTTVPAKGNNNVTTASSGSSGSNGEPLADATATAGAGSGSATGSSLAFTGEPAWVQAAARVALALSALSAMLALGLRSLRRRKHA